MGESAEPAYETWGQASVRLMRAMRIEAARSGESSALPNHLLLAVFDMAEVFQVLRAIRAPVLFLASLQSSQSVLQDA